MASTAKRRSARKRDSNTRQTRSSDVPTSSPSRPAKRRKRVSIAAPVNQDPETDDNGENDDSADEGAVSADDADRVIAVLAEADYTPLVAMEHPNNGVSSIAAYAKIAGRSWTYYVQSSSINIGRAPDKEAAANADGYLPTNGVKDGEGSEATNIDLGPSKLVSRLHAAVYYDEDAWHISIKGRNGVRVNDQLLKRTHQRTLVSGDVIEIAGTEMIFVTPAAPVHVHEMYMRRLDNSPDTSMQPPPAKKARRSTNERQTVPAHLLNEHEPPKHVSPYAAPDSASSTTHPTTIPPPEPPRPSTPVNALLSAPYLSQNATDALQPPGSGPTNPPPPSDPHLTIESNEQVDYAADAFKDVKPPMSYATLIAQAILSTSEGKLSLNGIYEWIATNFAYYRHNDGGWQNSIRHNLSLSPDFVRVAREAHEPGKGGLWRIADDKREDYVRKGMKITSRGGARQSSNPNTPLPKRSPKRSPKKNISPGRDGANVKPSPSESSPVPGPYHSQHAHGEVSTPSRLPKIHRTEDQPIPQLSTDAPPLRAPYLTQNAAGAGSPPPLSSSAYLQEHHQLPSLYTPAPQRHEPQFTMPSTGRLPSQYLPQSSPFPFWKEAPLGTPAMLPDTSPLKAQPTGHLPTADAHRFERPPQSSSPPPATVGHGSPTRHRGIPIEPRLNGMTATDVLPRKPPTPPLVPKHHSRAEDNDDTIDLMGSFPAIGARQVSNAAH